MLTVWSNERMHGNLEEESTMGRHPDKKSRTPPHTCIYRSRQEPASETTEKRPARHEDTNLLAEIFRFRSKRLVKGELGGFIYAFAEITVEKEPWNEDSTEADFSSNFQYTLNIKKKQVVFQFFSKKDSLLIFIPLTLPHRSCSPSPAPVPARAPVHHAGAVSGSRPCTRH